MAHFYGWLQGNRGDATRMGSKDSGFDAWIQGWQSRITTHLGHDFREDKDYGRATFGTGPSNYNGGSLTIHFDNLDDVIDALGTQDPKIEALRKRVLEAVAKLDEEAPKALKRAERRRKRELKAVA